MEEKKWLTNQKKLERIKFVVLLQDEVPRLRIEVKLLHTLFRNVRIQICGNRRLKPECFLKHFLNVRDLERSRNKYKILS